MLNPLSLSVSPIELINNEKSISAGTGFFYQSQWGNKQCTFLVTNYHVVSGNDPSKRDADSPKGDSIIFYYHFDSKSPKATVGVKMPLFSKGKHFWLEHRNPAVDIVLVPIIFSLPVTPEWRVVGKDLIDTDLDISPSDPVTLIGYPNMFIDSHNALPIYKTGAIASEPEYDFDGNPCFVIDISAFGGNSGSPVFSIQKNAQIVSKEILIKSPGSMIKFLGVYSAGYTSSNHELPIYEIRDLKECRSIVTDLDLQLGVVWKANLIEEIISQNSASTYKQIAESLVKEKDFKFKISNGLKIGF